MPTFDEPADEPLADARVASAEREGRVRRALRALPIEHDIGQWKQIAPGAVWSAVEIPGLSKGQVRLLGVAAGAALPAHGHDGPEYTCVLAGSYADHSGRFAAGDMAEADTEVDHQLIAAPDSECVCLIAMEGKLRLHGG